MTTFRGRRAGDGGGGEGVGVEDARPLVHADTGRRRSGSRSAGATAAEITVVCAAASVPLAFTRRLDDAFFLPKFCLLWALLGVGAFALLSSRGGARAATRATARHADLVLALYVAVQAIATWLSTDRRISVFGERLQHQGLLSLLLYAGFYALCRRVFTRVGSVTNLLVGVTAGGAIVAGYGLAQRVGADPIWDGFLPEGRIFSTIGQANALAAYLLTVAIVSFTLAWITRATPRLVAAWVGAAALVALSSTKSRGGLGAAIVVALAMGTFAAARLPRRRLAAVALVGVLLVAVTAALPPARSGADLVWTRLTMRGGDGEGANASLSARNHVDSWIVAVAIVRGHPLHGTGPETFPDQFPSWSREVLAPERVAYFDQFRVESPHNIFLHAGVGAGVPGVALLVAAVAALVRHFARAARSTGDRRVRAFATLGMLVLLGHLLTNFFMSPEVTGTWLVATLLGALVAVTSGETAPSREVVAESAQVA